MICFNYIKLSFQTYVLFKKQKIDAFQSVIIINLFKMSNFSIVLYKACGPYKACLNLSLHFIIKILLNVLTLHF